MEIEKVDGEAGNSSQTPPNGKAWGYGKEHPDHPDNGNNGGGNGENPDGDGTDNSGGNGNNIEAFIFFYHPDHLGSSSYISDANDDIHVLEMIYIRTQKGKFCLNVLIVKMK